MAVLIILGLLAGAVTLSVRSYIKRAYKERVNTDLVSITQAIETYEADNGDIPTSNEGLAVLTQATEGFPNGILSKPPVDPWGNSYQYNRPGRDGAEFEVICFGSDGMEGGEGAAADVSTLDL
jgi:general secretion pathway protein G